MRVRRRLLAVLAVPAAVVLLGACGDDDTNASSSDGPNSPVTAPPVEPPAGDVNPDAPERRTLAPVGGLDNPIPSAIESYAELGGSTIELRFYAGVETCYGLDEIVVDETEADVTVTLLVGSLPGADVCIEIAEAVKTRVDLSAPLGGRTLLDGSTGQPIPVD